MSEFREFLNEQLHDDEFREQWEKIQPEMDLIRAVPDAGLSQNSDIKEWTQFMNGGCCFSINSYLYDK